MNNPIADTFGYSLSKDFNVGMTMACIFLHPVIYNEDEITHGSSKFKPDAKPKYCIVTAIPVEDKRLKTRNTENVKFSCTEDEYNFFLSIYPELSGKEVYIGVEVNSWATDADKHGVWYRYISGSIRRFDGKPIHEKLPK